MPSLIQVEQSNGKQWLVTQCEIVIPIGGAAGMSPTEFAKSFASCESASNRLNLYVGQSNASECYFSSLKEFEEAEMNPSRKRVSVDLPDKTFRPGTIYLAKGEKYYKIGRSSNFAVRERQLTTKLPFHVEIVHTIYSKDSVSVERLWHERFRHLRIRGEWFLLSEAEVSEFCSHSEM